MKNSVLHPAGYAFVEQQRNFDSAVFRASPKRFRGNPPDWFRPWRQGRECDPWNPAVLQQVSNDSLAGVDRFAPWAAEAIVATDAGVFGFSSICNSYPTSLRIAEGVKRLRPDCTIIFGGPQASVVDVRTLEAFPFVDFVLRGVAP